MYNMMEKALLAAGVAPSYGNDGHLCCLAVFPVDLTEDERASDRHNPKSLWNRAVMQQKDKVIHVLLAATVQNAHAKSELGRAEFSRYLRVELKENESPREGRDHLLHLLRRSGLRPISLRIVAAANTPWGEKSS